MKTKLFLFLLPTQTLASLGGNTFPETEDESNRELRRFGFWSWRDRPNAQEIASCASSSDCEMKQYCSTGQCRGFGDCASDFDCRNPGNTYPVIECTGPLKCNDEGNCGRECGNPCENGTGGFQECLVQPCSNAKNTCETTFVSCLNDYCRGCDPLVFDAAGNHEECTGNVVVSNICASTSDCDEGYYCSFGECREFGQCSKNVDCFNPENEYYSIECVGPISCESGTCGRVCAGSFCPDDQPPVDNCSSPCSDLNNACEETYVFCMDDNCGGCNAIALDASGTQVCTVTQCASSLDCGDEGQYCAGGKCLNKGRCETELDCRNPNNIYSVIPCIGVLQCDAGHCGIACGPECAHGGPPVNCYAQPCSVVQCDEDHESCLDDYCNGCGTIFLDPAGNEVCT